MAHQVIIEEPTEKKVEIKEEKIIERVKHFISVKTPPLIDSLVLITIAFWYFFFTGIAIARGKSVPKEWMRIATQLSKGRIAKKIRGVVEKENQPNKYKVVDIATKRPIPIP